MDDKGVCKDCNNRKYCEDYKPNKWQCEDYEAQHTNEEWLEQASTEEKAKVLYNFFMARTFCHICPENNVCDIGYKCKYGNGEVEDFIKWLKQPHKPKE